MCALPDAEKKKKKKYFFKKGLQSDTVTKGIFFKAFLEMFKDNIEVLTGLQTCLLAHNY